MTVKESRLTVNEAEEIFDSLVPYGVNPKGRSRFVRDVTRNSSTDIYLESGYSFSVSFHPTGYLIEPSVANDYDGDIIHVKEALANHLNLMYRKFEP